MNQELQLGKYEFYPYTEEDFKNAPSLEELLGMLNSMTKAKGGKDVETPSRSIDPRRRLVKLQNYYEYRKPKVTSVSVAGVIALLIIVGLVGYLFVSR